MGVYHFKTLDFNFISLNFNYLFFDDIFIIIF